MEHNAKKVTQLNDIMTFSVMTTPGLADGGKVISQEKVLSSEQIADYLKG